MMQKIIVISIIVALVLLNVLQFSWDYIFPKGMSEQPIRLLLGNETVRLCILVGAHDEKNHSMDAVIAALREAGYR
jgi:hypothetical protein